MLDAYESNLKVQSEVMMTGSLSQVPEHERKLTFFPFVTGFMLRRENDGFNISSLRAIGST